MANPFADIVEEKPKSNNPFSDIVEEKPQGTISKAPPWWMREIVKPTMEYGGMAIGGATGALAGGGVASAISAPILAGGGYALGRRGYRELESGLYGTKEPRSEESVGRTLGEIKEGALLEVGGQALGKGIGTIAKSTVPESIMSRTMKMPPGSLKAESREKVLETMVRQEKLPLGKKTLPKMNEMIAEIDDGIAKTLENISSQGGSIDANSMSRALDKLKTRFANRSNPKEYYDVIDSVKQDYISHSFVNRGQLSLSDAQKLKKGTYEEIQAYYGKLHKPETGRVGIKNDIEAQAKAEVAKTLRQEVLNHPDVPESIRKSMGKEAGLMNARKWVERAVNRGQNLDPINLSGMLFGVLVEGGVSKAVAYRIAMSQPVMSRLAIGIAKVQPILSKIAPVAKEGLKAGYIYGKED